MLITNYASEPSSTSPTRLGLTKPTLARKKNQATGELPIETENGRFEDLVPRRTGRMFTKFNIVSG